MTVWRFAAAFHAQDIYTQMTYFSFLALSRYFYVSTQVFERRRHLAFGPASGRCHGAYHGRLWKLSPRGKEIVKVPVGVVQVLGLEDPKASAVQGSAEQMTAGTVSEAGAEDNGALEIATVTLGQGRPSVDGAVLGTGEEGG